MPNGTRVVYVDPRGVDPPVSRHLERRGLEVRALDDGAAALSSLEWADCVVAAYDLPDGTGVDLLRRVRERAPDLPYVIYTDRGNEAVASEAIAAGVTDYVPMEAGEDAGAGLAERLERVTGSGRRNASCEDLVEQLALPVYVTDDDGVLTAINRRAAEVTGYDREAVIGRPASEILPSDVIDGAEDVIHDLLSADASNTTAYDLTIPTAAGGTLDVENHVALRTEDGEPRGTIGVLVPADGRPEARLRRLHEATRELMAETDPVRIAERTAEAARDVLEIEDAAVYLAPDDTTEAADGAGDVAASEGVSGLEMAAGAETTGASAQDRVAAAYRTGDSSVGLVDLERDTGGGPGAYFPLGDHGVIAVTGSETDAIDAADVQLATVLAANAEAALDRAANEKALRRERDDLAALFENIPDPAVETTMQDGEPIVGRVNTAFESVFGYDGEVLRGENVDDYIVPEDRAAKAERYNDRVESGEGFQGEVRRRTVDGDRDFILHVVAHDVGETETRGYAIYTDITDQKQRQRELERQNERIEALHAVATRMKAAADRAEIYEIVIDAAEEILEFDLSLLDEIEDDHLVPQAISSGVSLDDYYEETPLDRENNLGAETARAGETFVVDDLRESRYAPANFEYRSALSVPLGEWGIFQAVATEEAAFSEADRQLAELLAEHAVAALDRQAREAELEARAETLARQNERLDQFASVVSHDLQNPLSVARGRLELARSTGDEDHYRAVERAHERIDELVNGLLTLARQGELRRDPIQVDLENAAWQAWRTVETGDLTLTVEAAPSVQADPERLRQLLENLFTNAVEHADGATTITVGGLEDGFYVADDGVGIPPGEREAILESGHSGSKEGTGLGLAIVDTVADAHDWELSITDSAGGGARFEFRTWSTESASG